MNFGEYVRKLVLWFKTSSLSLSSIHTFCLFLYSLQSNVQKTHKVFISTKQVSLFFIKVIDITSGIRSWTWGSIRIFLIWRPNFYKLLVTQQKPWRKKISDFPDKSFLSINSRPLPIENKTIGFIVFACTLHFVENLEEIGDW